MAHAQRGAGCRSGRGHDGPEGTIESADLLDRLPPPWPHDLLDEIRQRNQASGQCIVVLDDDPTGGQTLHGVPVLTDWSPETLMAEVARSDFFFVLANSRAVNGAEAGRRCEEIARNVLQAGAAAGKRVLPAIRSDSTLRGHFNEETAALRRAIGAAGGRGASSSILFVPYFLQGGRFTIDDLHYVLQGNQLVPVAQTEFARDPAFAYQSSHLPAWVEEKTSGSIPASSVLSVSIEDLRLGGPDVVAGKLRRAPEDGVVIVNAAADRDLEVLVAALQRVEPEGKSFLYRTAASFVRVRAGIPPRGLLTREEVAGAGPAGGLVVVGSYVARTTEQLEAASRLEGVLSIELDVDRAIAPESAAEPALGQLAAEVSRALAGGSDVILYTSRLLRTGATPDETLAAAGRVSQSLSGVVAGLSVRPRFLIAKGGNTANDLAGRALRVRRATVLGQLLPGVPVWRLGEESRFPGLGYVVFPGNVGTPDSLAEAIRLLRA